MHQYICFWSGMTLSLCLSAMSGQCAIGDDVELVVVRKEDGSGVSWLPKRQPPGTLGFHKLKLGADKKLLSWLPQSTAYRDMLRKQWDWLLRSPVDSKGRQHWYLHFGFDPETLGPDGGNNTVGDKNPHFVDSALWYYAYSGDRRVVDLARDTLAYHLQHGSTPSDWLWASVPYPNETSGRETYNGFRPAGGDFVVETDKIGAIGFAYLRLYQFYDEPKFLEAALRCANSLTKHVRTGNATQSPWPWRVHAETGEVKVDYTTNLAGTLELFDELIRMNAGEVASYERTRRTTLEWILKFPMKNNSWSGYYGDVRNSVSTLENRDQQSPMEMARYFLLNPQADPNWRSNVPRLIKFVEDVFGQDNTGGEKGMQYGARVIDEQFVFMLKISSHTVRYAHVTALLAENTGDATAKEKAFRSFNWGTYMVSDSGLTITGLNDHRSRWWYEDSYFDFMRHYQGGMAAVPQWAPPRKNHLLRSSSVVTKVSDRESAIEYTTFRNDATEVLRTKFKPTSVKIGGVSVAVRKNLNAEGYTLESLGNGDYVVRIRHTRSGSVSVSSSESTTPHDAATFNEQTREDQE